MANVSILFQSLTDTGTYTGGSWVATLGLDNLKNRHPSKVARSTNDANASTLFVVQLTRVCSLQAFALVNHNLSSDGTVRIRVSDASDGSSPSLDVTVDVGDFDDAMTPGGPILVYIHSDIVTGLYVLINIDDDTNSDNYVQVGRFMAGLIFTPEVNVSHGAALGFIDDSRISRAVDMTRYADIVPKRRSLSGAFDWLDDTEGLGSVYDMQLIAGITGGVLVIFDPDETGVDLARQTIYGTLTELAPIVHQHEHDHPHTWRFNIEELL